MCTISEDFYTAETITSYNVYMYQPNFVAVSPYAGAAVGSSGHRVISAGAVLWHIYIDVAPAAPAYKAIIINKWSVNMDMSSVNMQIPQ